MLTAVSRLKLQHAYISIFANIQALVILLHYLIVIN